MKKISVLIPTYKPDNYIKKCFNSFENQTIHKDKFCVYVALNGSKKSYEKYIFKLLEKVSFDNKYIYIEQAGVSNARNKLIEASVEDFIVFIDDDDIVSENYLENLLKVSTKTSMGVSNAFEFKNDIKNLEEYFVGKSFVNLKDEELSKYKSRKYFSLPCAKMLHRDMIQDIRFDTNLKKNEDSLFMATISKNIKSIKKTSKETCYFVYTRENSVDRSKIEFFTEFKMNIYVLKKYIKLFFHKDYEKIFIATRIAATLIKIMKIPFHNKKIKKMSS